MSEPKLIVDEEELSRMYAAADLLEPPAPQELRRALDTIRTLWERVEVLSRAATEKCETCLSQGFEDCKTELASKFWDDAQYTGRQVLEIIRKAEP